MVMLHTTVLTAIMVSILLEVVWCQWDKYRGPAFAGSGPGRQVGAVDNTGGMSPSAYGTGPEVLVEPEVPQQGLDCAFIMEQCQCDSLPVPQPQPQSKVNPKGGKGKGSYTTAPTQAPVPKPVPQPQPQQQQQPITDYGADYY